MIDVPPESLQAQEQVIEKRLLDCGLNPGGFTVKYEEVLQSIEIVIAPSAGATSDSFACINDAAGFEIVRFQDGAMFAAYMDFSSDLARPQMMVTYEGRLKEAVLWVGFPDREGFGSLREYAQALEVHAGVKPGSALRVLGEDVLFDPPRTPADHAGFVERYSKLLLVTAYASIKERVHFGFIGNESVEK
jgi:hypothetical protein